MGCNPNLEQLSFVSLDLGETYVVSSIIAELMMTLCVNGPSDYHHELLLINFLIPLLLRKGL